MMEKKTKTNQTPKSKSNVLQEALVSQAYCAATDFQVLAKFSESRTNMQLKISSVLPKKYSQRKRYSGKSAHWF